MQVGDPQAYLDHGPGFIFLFHPALGPVWDIVSQKICRGRMLARSELVLEVHAPLLLTAVWPSPAAWRVVVTMLLASTQCSLALRLRCTRL